MKKCEIACVKMAVKRSVRANNIKRGYRQIEEWKAYHLSQGYEVDERFVLKCFKKWIKNKRKAS